MTEQLETNTRQCGLIQYCGDFHVVGRETCEGLRNYQECPLFIEQKQNRYNNRFSPGTI